MCLIYWKEEQHTHTEKVSERDRETWRERLPCTDSLPQMTAPDAAAPGGRQEPGNLARLPM